MNNLAYWEEFTELVLAKHPEWAPFVIGAVDGRAPYDPGDERFYIDIPSVHPTRREPLVIELADRLPGGPIDTYWGDHFEHNFCWPKRDYETQIGSVIRRVEEWISDNWVFLLGYDRTSGRRITWGGYFASEEKLDYARLEEENLRLELCSWRGTHDRVWP